VVVVDEETVVVVVETIVVVDAGSRTTTLVREAKFSSPGVPTLSARTVNASDVRVPRRPAARERPSGPPIRRPGSRPGRVSARDKTFVVRRSELERAGVS